LQKTALRRYLFRTPCEFAFHFVSL
jgi:hypothetical protein